MKGLAKKYGERSLFSGLNFTVEAGAVVGVVRRRSKMNGRGLECDRFNALRFGWRMPSDLDGVVP